MARTKLTHPSKLTPQRPPARPPSSPQKPPSPPTLSPSGVLPTPTSSTPAKPVSRPQESTADAYSRALSENAAMFKEQLATALITSAMAGNPVALKEINDRILGKNNAEVSDKEDYTLIPDARVDEIYTAWLDTKAYFEAQLKERDE